MSRRLLIAIVVILLIIVVGMVLTVRRSALKMHRGDPGADTPATAPAKAK